MKNFIKNNFIQLLSFIFIIIDLMIIGGYYNSLPSQIPSHFDGDFIPTDYSGKNSIFSLWVIHLFIILLLNAIFIFLRKRKSPISKIVSLIIVAQLPMMLIDTLRTIFISINPNDKTNFSVLEYATVIITIGVGISGYAKQRNKA